MIRRVWTTLGGVVLSVFTTATSRSWWSRCSTSLFRLVRFFAPLSVVVEVGSNDLLDVIPDITEAVKKVSDEVACGGYADVFRGEWSVPCIGMDGASATIVRQVGSIAIVIINDSNHSQVAIKALRCFLDPAYAGDSHQVKQYSILIYRGRYSDEDSATSPGSRFYAQGPTSKRRGGAWDIQPHGTSRDHHALVSQWQCKAVREGESNCRQNEAGMSV